jgi:hypothetical protein
MKKLFILLIASQMVLSCSNDDSPEPITIDFAAELPSFYMFTGYESEAKTSPIALPYEESYTFNADGTLTKTRTDVNNTTKVSGVFSVVTVDGFQNINITLENDDITTSCVSSPQENLIVNRNQTVVNRTSPCDGPDFRYTRID